MKRILEVKKKIGNLSKNSKNPFFKSAYLDLTDLLNAVEPLLHEQGLLLLQPIEEGGVWTRIYDAATSKLLIESSIQLPDLKDPQKLGSAITYFRRYTLKSLLAITEADDDGNLAAKPVQPPKLIPFQGKLKDKAVADAVERIAGGEDGLLSKIIEKFNLTVEEIELINNAVKVIEDGQS